MHFFWIFFSLWKWKWIPCMLAGISPERVDFFFHQISRLFLSILFFGIYFCLKIIWLIQFWVNHSIFPSFLRTIFSLPIILNSIYTLIIPQRTYNDSPFRWNEKVFINISLSFDFCSAFFSVPGHLFEICKMINCIVLYFQVNR